jgi:hypothetical protein
VLSARRGACPRSESLLARHVRLRRRRRPRMPPPLPSRSARRDARVHCRRRACGDAAFCGAIRRGGSSASSSRSRRVDPALPLAVGVARSPLAWRRAAGRAAAQSAASTAARRAVPMLASARALEACPAACPPHCLCLYARGDLRPGSELPPPLVPWARRCYRAMSWLLALPLRCPRAARRAGDTIAARAPAAGARHHPASLRGGRRALACVCGCATLEGAGGAAATAIALLERALRRGCLSGRADESVALSARQVACPGSEPPAGPAPSALRRLRTPPPLPSHSAQRAAGVRPPPTCSAAMWRSAVRSASVAARSPRPGARRLDLTASPAVGGARSPRPLGDACCRPGRGPVRYARRRVGERRWCSLRRTLWRRAWRRARPRARCTACGPEAMCG